MPLSMAPEGKESVIRKIGGKEETRLFLERLGFVVGAIVTVVSEIQGNLIVNVKDSRVAIGKDMASKILVSWEEKFCEPKWSFGSRKGVSIWKHWKM